MKRSFIPTSFKITTWDLLEPFFIQLQSRAIHSKEDLWQWMLDRSELETIVSEDLGWRYIRMTCNTEDETIKNHFNYFVAEIQPKIAPYSNQLDEKVLANPYLKELSENKGMAIVTKLLEKDKAIFREENIDLFAQIEQESQNYGEIAGGLTIEWEGKEITLQQASNLLLEPSAETRQAAWEAIQHKRFEVKEALTNLFISLRQKRHQVAVNAGFNNFRDYMFVAMGRFDYDQNACYTFHEAIKKQVVPILNELNIKRAQALDKPLLKPWDLAFDYQSSDVLKAFKDGDDLLAKSIECFKRIDSYAAHCIETMKEKGHFDLMSRKGKAPGGYNYPLDETGIPFIFMNATSALRDLVTMVHEGGHALHSFLVDELPLNYFKHPTSEVAELASMSMELISMEHWNVFFEDEQLLKRAKREHLESIIQTLPWVATVDLFQHQLYEHPEWTDQEIYQAWVNILSQFSIRNVDWSAYEKFKEISWQKQLHIFEVPFYYIEYGMAQLGAIAVWKNYKENPTEAMLAYKKALSLGYTCTIPELYQAANVSFDFSASYIQSLMDFVLDEYKKLVD
jgi:oligoendopeptidase F